MSKELKYDQESFRDGLTDNYSWFAKDKKIQFGQSLNLNDSLKINAKRARVFINLSNYSRSSLWTEPIPALNKSTNNHKRLGELLAGNSSWLVNKKDILVGQLKDENFTGHNEIFVHIRDVSAQRLNTTSETSWSANSGSSSTVVVLPGESVQAAIDAATSGDTIEVRSGTYRENIYIDKQLSILGADVGGGLPVVDADGIGNAILIASDKVVLDGLIATNSSGEETSGIKLEASNHCIINGIKAYNNNNGVTFTDCSNNTLFGSNLSGNDYGIRLYYSNNNTIYINNITDNVCGIYLAASKGNAIVDNFLDDNSRISIECDKAGKLNNKFLNNTGLSWAKPVKNQNVTLYSSGLVGKVEDEEPVKRPGPSSDRDGDNSESGLGIESQQKNPSTSTEELQTRIDEEIERLPWGQIIFTPPEKMSKDVPYLIIARISRDLYENMTEGLEKFENAKTEKIKVSYEMNVKLDGGKCFKIDPETQEPKTMPKGGFVEWTWQVVPQEPGIHALKLIAMASISLKNSERRVEEKVFEKDIVVYVDHIKEFKTFFLSSGTWAIGLLVTTLVGGIIALLTTGIIGRIRSKYMKSQENVERQNKKEN